MIQTTVMTGAAGEGNGNDGRGGKRHSFKGLREVCSESPRASRKSSVASIDSSVRHVVTDWVDSTVARQL